MPAELFDVYYFARIFSEATMLHEALHTLWVLDDGKQKKRGGDGVDLGNVSVMN